MGIDVSIIIPAYNCEEYIEKCIKSVLNQNGISFEIVVVNDGSTDSTGEIISSIAANDNRIIYIDQENHGVSYSRNKGLSLANGEFCLFVDSDDYVSENSLKAAVSQMRESNAQIGVFAYNIKGKKNTQVYSYERRACIDLNNIDIKSFASEVFLTSEYRTAVWNKLFKTALIKGVVEFEKYGYVNSEDSLFNIKAITLADKLLISDTLMYYHIEVENSLSGKKKYDNVYSRNYNWLLCVYNILSDSKKFHSLLTYYYICTVFNIASLEICVNKGSLWSLYAMLKQLECDIKDKKKDFAKDNLWYEYIPGEKRVKYRAVYALMKNKMVLLTSLVLYMFCKYIYKG